MNEPRPAGTDREPGGTEKNISGIHRQHKAEQLRWGVSQHCRRETCHGMQERWEAQLQQFLKSLQPILAGRSGMSEASPWEDSKEFLASFEQVAKACRWPRDQWAAHLLPALSGEAEEAFRGLEARDQENYEKVKAAILRGEALRTERQRQHFRQFCCQVVEDPRRIHSQLQELCRQWLKPERRTKEQILELLILEQFLASLPPELRSWIQVRRPESCSQAVALVEDFLMSQQEAKTRTSQGPLKEEPVDFLVAENEPLNAAKGAVCDEPEPDVDAKLLVNGFKPPGVPLLLTPPKEVSQTDGKEDSRDFKETEGSLQIVKQGVTQPGLQQTMLWQVLQEADDTTNRDNLGCPEAFSISSLCSSPSPLVQPASAPPISSTATSPPSSPAPMGIVAATMSKARNQGLLDPDELAQCSAFPVAFVPNATGALVPQMEPLPLKTIRDLKTAVSMYGIQAPYVKGLFNALAGSFTMTPQDWKGILRMLLTGLQYVVWESDFHREAQSIAQQAGVAAITPDHISGSGAYVTFMAQMQFQQAIFPLVTLAALRALDKTDDSNGIPSASFSKIHQGPNQPFSEFIDDLQNAIDRQITNATTRAELLLKLAYENANADCQRILQPLAAKADATLADFLKACRIVGTSAFSMDALAAAIQQGGHPSGNCFNCGKPGHFKAQCRAPGGGASHKNNLSMRPKTVCPKCKKGFHWGNQCRSGSIRTAQSEN